MSPRPMFIAFGALYSSIVSALSSRPKPLSPDAAHRHARRQVEPLVTHTIPASSSPAMRCARARSRVQTPAASPYWSSLARATASSSSREALEHRDRAEDLLARGARRAGRVVEQRRLRGRSRRRAARGSSGARRRCAHGALRRPPRRCSRAPARDAPPRRAARTASRVERVADAMPRAQPRRSARRTRRGPTRARAAATRRRRPRRWPCRCRSGVGHGGVEVGVGADHHRALAAELHDRRRQRPAGARP